MDRKTAIQGAYKALGKEATFYDGMITCSTLVGKAICKVVWNMSQADNNRFIEAAVAGIPEALMYFGINDSKAFAEKCGMELLEVKTFYPDALAMLGKRLNLVTRVSMKVAEKKKQVLILHLKLN